MRGQYHDGHDFIPEAIANGARLLVVEKHVDVPDRSVKVVRVGNTRAAFAELACNFYQNPSRRLTVIGVTGTNGKTTTSHLCHWLLSDSIRTGLVGSSTVDTGRSVFPGGLTTPESITLQSYMHDMVQSGARVAVLEVSSHGIKQHRIKGIHFDAAIFTNISKDHLDYHKSFSDYLTSKLALFRQLPEHGLAVLNCDDPCYEAFAAAAPCRRLYYSLGERNPVAQLVARNVRCNFDGCYFDLVIRPGMVTAWGNPIVVASYPVFVPLLGKHNVSNALAAIGLALWQGANPEACLRRLERFVGVRRRLQIVTRHPWTIIDDYAHNQASIRVALQTLANLPYRRLHLLISIRGNRGAAVNEQIAEEITDWLDKARIQTVVATSSVDTVTSKDRVTEQERLAFLRPLFTYSRLSHMRLYEERRLEDALKFTLSIVEPGDVILMTGAQGMDRAQEILGRVTNDFLVLRR